MNILKAIGAFFQRIWRWIMETAWVQPLLIVGGIFGIIFSIPKFTSWAQKLSVSAGDSYYTSFKISLEGEGRDNGAYDTGADKITSVIAEFSNFDNEFGSYEEFLASYKSNGADGKKASGNPTSYPEKFFIAYVGKDCAACDTAQGGFETLQERWGESFTAKDGRSFALYTIFADDTSSNDDDYDTDDDKKPFCRYLDKFGGNPVDFFSKAGGRLEETPYKSNMSISESYYEHVETADRQNFDTPTIFLIDFSREAFELGRPGISEAIFGVSGETDYAKATLLMNMWNHTDVSDTDNPFTVAYQK